MAERIPHELGKVLSQKRNALARKIYFLGLCLLAIGLPLSMFLMSVSQFVLLGAWFIDGEIKSKLKAFINNKPAVVVAGIFLIHIVGLLYSEDLKFGLNDLRIKLPLIILPVVMSGFPKLNLGQFRKLSWYFISAVLISSMISVLVLAGVIPREVNNIRDISILISHIRLSLLVCIAIFYLGWMMRDAGLQGDMKKRLLLVIPIFWLIGFLVILESVTGLGILLIVSIIVAAIRVFTTQRKWPSILFLVIVVSFMGYSAKYVQKVYEHVSFYAPISDLDLKSTTKKGNTYYFALDDNQFENGHKVWAFICWDEIEQAWPMRSQLDLNSKDKRNQELKVTLIRYLSSKGLKKDEEGINALTDQDIHNVEKGIANVNHVKKGNIFARIDQIVWEYHRYKMSGNPSGHSTTQRLEYWKTASAIIAKNKLTGVGTGDPPAAFREEYIFQKSKLSERWRLRAHNQYLAIGVALGIPGLMYFFFALIYPGIVAGKFNDLLFLSFLITACFSMLTEDTLETQAGATFFAFFYCLFLLVKQDDPVIMVQSES